MKVLLTGATGFIGKHVLRLLTQHGHTVRCLVRATSDTGALDSASTELAVGDVTDPASVAAAVGGCEAVVHLANIYDFRVRHRRDYRRVNVDGTRNVMEAALSAGVKKVVHVSSIVAYGYATDNPLTEESVPASRHPSAYGRSKLEGENVAWSLHRDRGLPLVVVNPYGVTGPSDGKPSGRYIESLVTRKMPAQVLVDRGIGWAHVRDVARVIVVALEKEGNTGERYFATAEYLSFGDLNRLVADASGVRLPRLVMPGFMLYSSAALLTFLGRLFGFEPMLGMSLDQIRTMGVGFQVDGSKATRELGVDYTPVSVAIREKVAELQGAVEAR